MCGYVRWARITVYNLNHDEDICGCLATHVYVYTPCGKYSFFEGYSKHVVIMYTTMYCSCSREFKCIKPLIHTMYILLADPISTYDTSNWCGAYFLLVLQMYMTDWCKIAKFKHRKSAIFLSALIIYTAVQSSNEHACDNQTNK